MITEINGARINATQELQEALSQAGPNATLAIGGWRGSERLSLSAVTLERIPALE